MENVIEKLYHLPNELGIGFNIEAFEKLDCIIRKEIDLTKNIKFIKETFNKFYDITNFEIVEINRILTKKQKNILNGLYSRIKNEYFKRKLN